MQRARPPRRPWNRPRVHRSQVASRSCTPHASGRGGYGGAGPGRPHASRRRRRRTSRWPRLHGTASLRGQRRDEPDRPGIRPRVSLPTPSRPSRPGPGARRPGPSGDPRGRARIGRGRRRRAPTRWARWQATPGGTCDDVWVRCGRCTPWTGGLRHWRLPCRSRGGARPCPGGGMGVDQGSARTASDRRRPPLWSSRRRGCASASRQSGQRRRRVSGLDGVTPSAPAVPVSGGTACAACTRDVTVMAVKACWISSAYAGMAARFSMASGAARVRTNGSGSTSPPMPCGNASRWSQKHSAENCQRKKLRRETIPKTVKKTTHKTVCGRHTIVGIERTQTMVVLPPSTVQKASCQPTRAPLSILRAETVLSRFPIHNLTQGREVSIHMTQTNAQGTLELRWEVSYNERYGPPGPLAYKLDTIVINQILDGLPRPLPRVLKAGSLLQISVQLDLQVSGRQYAHLKRAFHQNASAYIVAYLRYRGHDGIARTVNTGFTRYSVMFTGEILPDGTPADAVYLVLSEPY